MSLLQTKHVVIVRKHCVVSYKKMHMDPANKHLVLIKASHSDEKACRYYTEMLLLLHEHPAIMKQAKSYEDKNIIMELLQGKYIIMT